MTSMLALIGGVLGMFVLFGVAWKLLQPTLGWEAIADEVGPAQTAWQNEPTPNGERAPPRLPTLPPVWTPIAQETIAYSVPPPPASPKQAPPAPARGRTIARLPPPPPPAEDDDGAATQFFDRAMLSAVEASQAGSKAESRMDRTEILGDEHVIELDGPPRRT